MSEEYEVMDPDDYGLCQKCREVIQTIIHLKDDVEDHDSEDPEWPLIYAEDHGLLCEDCGG